jgi:hypothetical protein
VREVLTSEELAEINALRKEVGDQERTIEIVKAATTISSRKRTLSRCGSRSLTPIGIGGR